MKTLAIFTKAFYEFICTNLSGRKE